MRTFVFALLTYISLNIFAGVKIEMSNTEGHLNIVNDTLISNGSTISDSFGNFISGNFTITSTSTRLSSDVKIHGNINIFAYSGNLLEGLYGNLGPGGETEIEVPAAISAGHSILLNIMGNNSDSLMLTVSDFGWFSAKFTNPSTSMAYNNALVMTSIHGTGNPKPIKIKIKNTSRVFNAFYLKLVLLNIINSPWYTQNLIVPL